MGRGIKLSEIAERMDLKNLTPELDLTEKEVHVPDVNRPALQLAGFFDHFDSNRVQIIGNVEYTYMQTLTEERRVYIYEMLLKHPIPCMVFCRGIEPGDVFLKKAVESNVPVFSASKPTSDFSAEIIRWMNVKLAPCISIHGVLVDVYGVGVLIMRLFSLRIYVTISSKSKGYTSFVSSPDENKNAALSGFVQMHLKSLSLANPCPDVG